MQAPVRGFIDLVSLVQLMQQWCIVVEPTTYKPNLINNERSLSLADSLQPHAHEKLNAQYEYYSKHVLLSIFLSLIYATTATCGTFEIRTSSRFASANTANMTAVAIPTVKTFWNCAAKG